MGTSPHLQSWAGAVGVAAAAFAVMAYVYTRYHSRVVYWS
jgi:lipopolysaccharide transport system permease protein